MYFEHESANHSALVAYTDQYSSNHKILCAIINVLTIKCITSTHYINPLRICSRVTVVCLSVTALTNKLLSVDPCCPSVVLTE